VKNITILFGGQSFEHEISIVSTTSIKDVLKTDFTFIFVDIDRSFYLIPHDKMKSKTFSGGEYKNCKKLIIQNGGFYSKSLFGTNKESSDYILNLIHGADGEDGKIASLLEFFDIKFIGPKREASVISCNKYYTKILAKDQNINIIDYKLYSKDDRIDKETITYPVIIKPLRLGSSIGVSIVKEAKELDYALDVAFEFDNQILIEPFINNIKEYNLAGCKVNDEFILSIVEEPQKEEFLDFDKKYLDFNRTSRVNEANISDELKIKIQESFKKIYNQGFDGALIRCDFFVVDNEVYLNEINPIPGSMANYLFDDFNSVIDRLFDSLDGYMKIGCDYKYINDIQRAKGK
jgi:D-alanine-D-alanine ligase